MIGSEEPFLSLKSTGTRTFLQSYLCENMELTRSGNVHSVYKSIQIVSYERTQVARRVYILNRII